MTPRSKPQPVPAPTDAPAALDDAVLVERARHGDAAAFELLMRRYNRMLFRVARGILLDDAEAEDALQEAWLSAHRALPTFRAEARLSTWLTRIAINTALMRRRRAASHPVLLAHGDDDATRGTATARARDDAQPTPEEIHMGMEARRLVERRIDELPDDYRIVFVLRVLEERSVEETARMLDLREATVRTRHFRARALLREALARELDVATDGAFAFDGARCDRIVSAVFARLARGGAS